MRRVFFGTQIREMAFNVQVCFFFFVGLNIINNINNDLTLMILYDTILKHLDNFWNTINRYGSTPCNAICCSCTKYY